MKGETQIGRTLFAMTSDREVVATRVLDAPRRLVWKAFTNCEHLPRWMVYPEGWTIPVCEIDLRPHGRWHLLWRGVQGEVVEMQGQFWEVRAPVRLVHTEVWGGDWPEALNTLDLGEKDGRTTVVATVTFASPEVRDRALETPLLENWAASHDRLEDYLRTMAGSNGPSTHSELPDAA